MRDVRWTCDFCGIAQITTDNAETDEVSLTVGSSKHGQLYAAVTVFSCANPACKEATIICGIYDAFAKDSTTSKRRSFQIGTQLWPRSGGKTTPDFVPVKIREDYAEAYLIRELSPKASATLSRRCLQGIIRDFCKIDEHTLHLAIKALRILAADGTLPAGVTVDAMNAIDDVCHIGNIGAHIEDDVNLIVTTEPLESQVLLELLNFLINDWYVERERRVMHRLALTSATERIKLQQSGANVSSTADASQDVDNTSTASLFRVPILSRISRPEEAPSMKGLGGSTAPK
jgi:Domain of unknown function (DUF4145)